MTAQPIPAAPDLDLLPSDGRRDLLLHSRKTLRGDARIGAGFFCFRLELRYPGIGLVPGSVEEGTRLRQPALEIRHCTGVLFVQAAGEIFEPGGRLDACIALA